MAYYAEFITGDIRNRNKIYRTDEFKLNGERVECYRSLFLFTKNFKDYVESTGHVTNYAGPHIADALVFDFDGEGAELENVRAKVVEFVKYLPEFYDLPVDYVRIAFSGSRGFHLSIPFTAICSDPKPAENFHKIYKSIIQDIAGTDWEYLDYNIYNTLRIFRITNTKHAKSGLYKIPLTWQELQSLSIDEIKTLAKEPRLDFEYQLPPSEIQVVEQLNELYLKWSNHKFDEKQKDERAAGDILKLLSGVGQGKRNDSLIRLTGHYLRAGLKQDEINEILRMWNSRNNPPLPDAEVEKTVQDACRRYAMPVNGDLKEYFYNPERAFEEKYKPYVKDSDKTKIKTGYTQVDDFLRGIRSGEVLCLLGKTGNSKSALAQNIGHNYVKQSNSPVLFFSLEMPIVSVIERSFQIETGLSGYDIENSTLRLLNGEASKLSMEANFVCDKIKNLYAIEKSGLTLEAIKKFIEFGEAEIYKAKTGLVLIDYLSLLDGRGRDIFEQTARLARELKDVAKELNVPVIFLSQVTKARSQFDELNLDDGRDSGAISEGADFILGLWKNDENDETIEYTLAILKNRRGKTGAVDVSMCRRSLRFTELNEGK